MTKLFTLTFYAMGIYLTFYCPTQHPYLIAFVFTFANGFLMYGLWVEGWLDRKK